jgi:hypothetical protein
MYKPDKTRYRKTHKIPPPQKTNKDGQTKTKYAVLVNKICVACVTGKGPQAYFNPTRVLGTPNWHHVVPRKPPGIVIIEEPEER